MAEWTIASFFHLYFGWLHSWYAIPIIIIVAAYIYWRLTSKKGPLNI